MSNTCKIKPLDNKQSGFTLVELAIVLVIIGLIIGGVLVGQDMIKAATIRSQIAQIQGYSSAVNTFRDKYGYIPGDIASTEATNHGFLPARTGAAGHGDGNSVLEACGIVAAGQLLGCETGIFWRDLTSSQLIDKNFSAATDAIAAVATAAVPTYFPDAKMARGNYVTVFSNGGLNFFHVGGISSVAAVTGEYTMLNVMSPNEAGNIDRKMDDNTTTGGSVTASETTAASATIFTTALALNVANCSAVAGIYNTDLANAVQNSPLCQLNFRFN